MTKDAVAPRGGLLSPNGGAVMEAALVAARHSEDAAELNAIRKAARITIDSLVREADPDRVRETLFSAAEVQAWACRRLGQMFPPQQGKRSDVKDLATSRAGRGKLPVGETSLIRYRKYALVGDGTDAAFAAAIDTLHEQGLPPTQTQLLKLVPANPARQRVVGADETLVRALRRTVALGRDLEDRAPQFEKRPIARLTVELAQIVEAIDVAGSLELWAGRDA